MTQDYDPATGISTTSTGVMYDAALIHPAVGPAWDAGWEAFYKAAIASGSIVSPPNEASEIRHTFTSRVIVVCFIIMAGLALVAPGLIWGFGR